MTLNPAVNTDLQTAALRLLFASRLPLRSASDHHRRQMFALDSVGTEYVWALDSARPH
jgi:hypothetical protein